MQSEIRSARHDLENGQLIVKVQAVGPIDLLPIPALCYVISTCSLGIAAACMTR